MKIEEIYENWKSLFPLSEAHVELLRNKFTTEYNYNSNHIEGNTLTYGQTSYTVHAGQYKTRPNSVITRYGDRFEYASPEEKPC